MGKRPHHYQKHSPNVVPAKSGTPEYWKLYARFYRARLPKGTAEVAANADQICKSVEGR